LALPILTAKGTNLNRSGETGPVTAIGVYAECYARRVGVAAVREINRIPAGRPPIEESIARPAGISLGGGNKADALIGAMTWSRTQIRPIGSWSRSLQTTIDVPLHNCLPSRGPRANGLGPPYFSEDRTRRKQPRAVMVVRADAFLAEAETPLHENEAPDVEFNDQRQRAS
jgi:hypothetical protein